MIKEVYRKIRKYVNIYMILKNKNKISAGFAVLTVVLATTGFYMKCWKGELSLLNVFASFLNSLKLFVLDFPKDNDDLNVLIILGIIFALITISFTVIVHLVKNSINKYRIESIFRKDHIAIFGLGEATTSFLNSYAGEKQKKDIAIIESDPNNNKLEELRKKGVGVFVGDSLSDKTLDLLNFKTMKYAIIAMGNDRINIELAEKIIHKYVEKKIETEIKLIIHIQNRDLDTLFHQKFMYDGLKKDEAKNAKIDVKTFSFFNEAAEGLFEEHRIDGDSDTYIKSNKKFKSILIGNGEFVKSVIYQMALNSHLPNENEHIVYIVDRYADNQLVKIKKYLYYREETSTFKIVAVNIDKNSLEYFEHHIWHEEDVVNVIIAYDVEDKNFNLAIDLFNRTYLSKVMDKQYIPKILFAIYDQSLLNDIIIDNEDVFKHFYTFGNSEKALSYNNLVEEENDFIARLINSDYGNVYNPVGLLYEKEKTKAEWHDSARYSDKLSNIAQAKHIDMKLKAMGLKRDSVYEYVKGSNTKSLKKGADNIRKGLTDNIENPQVIKRLLLHANRDIISKIFEKDRAVLKDDYYSNLVLEKDKLKEYSGKIKDYNEKLKEYKDELVKELKDVEEPVKTKEITKKLNEYAEELLKSSAYEVCFFPKEYNTLFEKMIRMEHNRWSAFHYLNGWKHAEIKDKDKKEHDCLRAIKDFDQDRLKVTVLYDMYSFLYLPNYLAEAGYEIVPIKPDTHSS